MQDHESSAWEMAYAAAVRETDRTVRRELIQQAQDAILDRARVIEEEGGTDAECTALEGAADGLAKMKLE